MGDTQGARDAETDGREKEERIKRQCRGDERPTRFPSPPEPQDPGATGPPGAPHGTPVLPVPLGPDRRCLFRKDPSEGGASERGPQGPTNAARLPGVAEPEVPLSVPCEGGGGR